MTNDLTARDLAQWARGSSLLTVHHISEYSEGVAATSLSRPSVHFTGREDILRTLLDFFAGDIRTSKLKVYVLLGEPGCGKTDIARYLADMCKTR